MRELKFRAWGRNIKEYMGKGNNPSNVINLVGDLINMDTWVIEQYTGLKDKNGKEIYEGDIVKSSYRITGDSEPTYTYHLVEWEVQPMDDYCGDIMVGLWLPDANEAIEVVGNIHENPELLEEK